MRRASHFTELTAPPQGAVVTIGNFDGVHRGHQALLALAVERARATGRVPTVLTFEPHPVRVLAPDLAPPLICTLEDKRALLAARGIELLLEQRFDPAFAALSPEAFVRTVLVDHLGARAVVVGYDFTFGARRAGTTVTLAQLGDRLGFDLDVLAARAVGEGLVASSTRVRAFVLEGKVRGATLVLGRPFHVNGVIARGQQRGRLLGFPTANLATDSELLPRRGVYACWLDWGEGARPAVANIGFNPTFGDGPGQPTVEAHVIDAAGLDLYGRPSRLYFVERLRDEQKFDGADALARCIARDRDVARGLLAVEQPPCFP
mgnify:CR=1 FL=1